MKGNRDIVIVEIDRTHETLVDCGGVELQIDVDFNQTGHARIYGIVRGLPVLSSKPEYEDVLDIGDTVYFHYNVVEDSHILENLYGVSIDRIFAVEKGECKCLHAVGDWVLLKPHSEYGEYSIVDGKMVELRKKGDLVIGIGEKQSAQMARVAYIADNDLGISAGMLVSVEPSFEFENTIAGEKYFCLRQEFVLGIINE